jgi:hypothetical protein
MGCRDNPMLENLEAMRSEDLKAIFCVAFNKQAAMNKALAHAYDCGDVQTVERMDKAEQELYKDLDRLVMELRTRGEPWWSVEDEETWAAWKGSTSKTLV